ncbi:hypothetical protein IQ266_06935 [filamentous cyanobacterium LEGE 11480]|uniref:Uncharacterized protein n=1 Tax=Romeriopsis navalis LEGE 11480 TaxID=2777977 RepID=A0A928VN73_9CYAN|nr:hypothetical protein [Romeriopsis navalis]MBE9029497.1 hypothetical protein [Romeriopsis navalis LEGE 11480]
MSFTKALRILITGLIYLCGGLILVGLAAWLHYGISAALTSDQVRPFENLSLTLGLGGLLIQLAASIEALMLSTCIQFRWLSYRRGRVAVTLFSLITLFYTLSKIWLFTSGPGIEFADIPALLLVEFLLLLPLAIAWFFLEFLRPFKFTFDG